MKTIELVEAIDLLRNAGWTVEPPAKRSTGATRPRKSKRVGRPPKTGATRPRKSKRVGRPPKNGRRKPGRPRKTG
jgi:hypothetical protein